MKNEKNLRDNRQCDKQNTEKLLTIEEFFAGKIFDCALQIRNKQELNYLLMVMEKLGLEVYTVDFQANCGEILKTQPFPKHNTYMGTNECYFYKESTVKKIEKNEDMMLINLNQVDFSSFRGGVSEDDLMQEKQSKCSSQGREQ